MRLLIGLITFATFASATAQLELGTAFRSENFEANVPVDAIPSLDKDTTHFQLLPGGPAWLKVSPSGTFSGTPTATDRGPQKWLLEARDSKNRAEVPVTLTVGNRPPRWNEPQATLDGVEEKTLSLDLTSLATDPDRDSLSFTKTRGPEWLQVTTGKLTGLPPEGSHGDLRARVEVTDGEKKESLDIRGKIHQKNYAPEIKPEIAFQTAEREEFSADITRFVRDRNEEDKLVYSLKTPKPPAWMALSAEGAFTAKPGFTEIGTHTIVFTVSDGALTSEGHLNLIVQRNPRPPVWVGEAPKYKGKTRETFTSSVGKLAKDLDGIALSFSKGRGANWLTVSPQGDLSGTPTDRDAGESDATLVARNDFKSAELGIHFTFDKKNYPPVVAKPFELTVKERETNLVQISQLGVVSDPDGETLAYSASKLPDWASLTATGELTLKPAFAQIGKHHFSLMVKDHEASVELPLALTVARNPRPPVWSNVPTYTLKTREPFKSSLAAYVKDADALSLRFAKVKGAEWITVSENGELSGTPMDADAGTHTVQVTAANDAASAPLVLNFVINKQNYRPQLVKAFEATLKERETTTLSLSKSGAVVDPDGEMLTFTSAKAPEWVSLSPNGDLNTKPAFAQIGSHKFTVSVKDKEAAVELPVTLTVVRNPRPPVWESPPSLSMKTREPFKTSIAGLAKDADGLSVHFSKLTGPGWVTVSDKGEITGTPADSDAGAFVLEVAAANDLASAPAKIRLEILKKNYPPKLVKEFAATVKEREVIPLSIATSGSVVDPDGEALVFSAAKLPAWVQLTPEGILTVSPLYAHIGQHKFTLSAMDKEQAVEVPIVLMVARSPRLAVWSSMPPFTLKTREPFKASLAGQAKDLDGLPLHYQKVSGPEWIAVGNKGELSGTPSDTDAGNATLVVGAASDGEPSASKIAFQITKKNHPPQLTKAFEATVKERDVSRLSLAKSGAVTDADGEPLTFSFAKAAPAWITLTPDGELSLQPQFAQIGVHKLSATAKDKEQAVDLPITLTVVRNPRAPQWTAEKLVLSALTREPFKASVAGKATDADGLAFTYAKVSGPAWVDVSQKGDIRGEPKDADAGSFDLVLQADNRDAAAPKTISLQVKTKNHAPVVQDGDKVLSCKERSACRWNLNDPKFVVDEDRDRLAFTLKEQVPWVALAPSGDFQVNPLFAQIGKHTFNIQVADNETKVAMVLTITADRDPRPPVWADKKLVYTTKAREALKGSLAGEAQDLDKFPIHFAKVSGPEWIEVSPAGVLSGAATDEVVGKHALMVEVANDSKSATKEVTVEVTYKNHAPKWAREKLEMGTTRAEENFSVSVRNLASDPDPDSKITFEKVRGPAWAVVSPDGQIFGKPSAKETGEQTIVVRALDAQRETAEATVQVNIAKGVPKPTPKENPVKLPVAYTGELFVFHLKKLFGNSPYGYRLLTGPKWLKLGQGGELSGVPAVKEEFDFTYEVTSPRGDTAQFAGHGKVN